MQKVFVLSFQTCAAINLSEYFLLFGSARMISIEFIDICRDSLHAYSIIKQRKKILFTPSQSKLTNLWSEVSSTLHNGLLFDLMEKLPLIFGTDVLKKLNIVIEKPFFQLKVISFTLLEGRQQQDLLLIIKE